MKAWEITLSTNLKYRCWSYNLSNIRLNAWPKYFTLLISYILISFNRATQFAKIIDFWWNIKQTFEGELYLINESKYSRLDQVNFFKGCLPQILLSPFLNTLSQMFFMFRKRTFKQCWLIPILHQYKQTTKGTNRWDLTRS